MTRIHAYSLDWEGRGVSTWRKDSFDVWYAIIGVSLPIFTLQFTNHKQQQVFLGYIYSLPVLWLLLTTSIDGSSLYWSCALCLMFVCWLLNNPIIAAQLLLRPCSVLEETLFSMQKQRRERKAEWEKIRLCEITYLGERGRPRGEGESERMKETETKKPLRDWAAVCVFMWEKEKDKGEKTEEKSQAESHLYKWTDLAHFTSASLFRRISLYHSHSAVPNCANWFQWTRNREIESLVTLDKDQGNTCKCCTDSMAPLGVRPLEQLHKL